MERGSMFGNLNKFESAGIWLLLAGMGFIEYYFLRDFHVMLEAGMLAFTGICSFAALYNLYEGLRYGDEEDAQSRE